MVLLGDNWFVEVSAKQATAICSRRLTSMQDQIMYITKQISDVEYKLAQTKELQVEENSFSFYEPEESVSASKTENSSQATGLSSKVMKDKIVVKNVKKHK